MTHPRTKSLKNDILAGRLNLPSNTAKKDKVEFAKNQQFGAVCFALVYESITFMNEASTTLGANYKMELFLPLCFLCEEHVALVS